MKEYTSMNGNGGFEPVHLNVGNPIVTDEDSVSSCAKLCESNEMSFGVMSKVGQGY